MKTFKTISDIGSVRIGNKSFNTLIDNGFGDGATKVCVCSDKEYVELMPRYITRIEGTNINIYAYDCSADDSGIMETLNGKYKVYAYNGCVWFVKEQT